jgi:hypothetical protein
MNEHEVRESWIIVYGNLSDGFAFYGPYDSFDDADEESRYLDVHPTWIATMYRNVERKQ